MTITVNGEEKQIQLCSIKKFLESEKIDLDTAIIEYNYKIIQKNQWNKILLQANDNLEILSFVGGG